MRFIGEYDNTETGMKECDGKQPVLKSVASRLRGSRSSLSTALNLSWSEAKAEMLTFPCVLTDRRRKFRYANDIVTLVKWSPRWRLTGTQTKIW